MKLRERNRKITHVRFTYTYKTTKTKKGKSKSNKLKSIRDELSKMNDALYEHLYRNKLISQRKAKGNIKKLNEMRPFIENSKDEMQVNEKILFQMKRILFQETRNKNERRKHDYNYSNNMYSAGSSSSEYIDFASRSILNGETNVYDSDATHCSQEVEAVYQEASYNKNEHNHYAQQSSIHNKVIYNATETNGVLIDDTIYMEDETLCSQATQQDEMYSDNLLDNYETQGEIVVEAAEEIVCNQTTNSDETIHSQANVIDNSEACNLSEAMQIMTLNEVVAPADFETAVHSPTQESSNIIENSQINDMRKLKIRSTDQGFDEMYGWLEGIREIRQPHSSEYFSSLILPPEFWDNGDFNVPEHIFRDLDQWH